jgi:hypothetical protein
LGDLSRQTNVKGTITIQTRIRGPQLDERASHGTNGFFNCSSPYRFTTQGEAAVTVPTGKYLQERDWVRYGTEEILQVEGVTKAFPHVPN